MTDPTRPYPTISGGLTLNKGVVHSNAGVLLQKAVTGGATAGHRYLFRKPKPGGGYNYFYHDAHGNVVGGKKPEKGTKELKDLPHRIQHQHHENIHTRSQKKHKELVKEHKFADSERKHHKKQAEELKGRDPNKAAGHREKHKEHSERIKQIKEEKEEARAKMDVAKMEMSRAKREKAKKSEPDVFDQLLEKAGVVQ